MKKIILIISILFIMIGNGKDNFTTYRSLIDGHSGFGKVFITDSSEPLIYENNTLNISLGDKIIWINDDDFDRFTLISEQGLWNDVILGTDKRFEYTFNNVGTFNFRLKERYSFQTINVLNPNNTNITGNINNTNITGNINNTNITGNAPLSTENNENGTDENRTVNGDINPSKILIMPLNISNLKKILSFL